MRVVRLDQIDDRGLGRQIGIGVKIAPAFGVNLARLQEAFPQHLAGGPRECRREIKQV